MHHAIHRVASFAIVGHVHAARRFNDGTEQRIDFAAGA